MNQRLLAFSILYECLFKGQYANLDMRKRLNELPSVQRAFVTELVNGVLRHYFELLKQLKIEGKISDKLKIILAMAIYERFYMQQKDYVIYNEYPKLVNKNGEKAFISAILHKLEAYHSFDDKDVESLSIHYSIPLWIVKLIKSQYSDDELYRLLKSFNTIPQVFYRLNKKKANYHDLNKYDIDIINDDSFSCKQNLINTNEFKNGYFYVQDVNSAKLYHYLDLNKDNTLLDICSAPGGKLFNCLDIIEANNAYANDLYAHRVELIKKMADKLAFEDINYFNYDGRYLAKLIDKKFDRILLDVPCSGLGILKRKPDLRYHIKSEDLDDLEKLQAELLESSSILLNEGGIMVYSTCTINKKENSKQILKFLNRHEEFSLLEEKTFIDEDGGDAFYVAKLAKS